MRTEQRRLADMAAERGDWQRCGWTHGFVGLWSEEHGFYFDVIRHDTERVPLKIYSMVGLVPLFAATVVEPSTLAQLPVVMQTVGNVLNSREFLKSIRPTFVEPGENGTRLLSVVSRARLAAILQRVLGPYSFEAGGQHHEVAYRAGDSDNRMFGGNSNWRGPIWFPMNFLLIQSIATSARYYGDSFSIECPTGWGRFVPLSEVADELAARLIRVFVRDDSTGRRAVLGDNEYFQTDQHWRDCVPFHEFFHGDSGAGLGAGHQTGWTALVALLLQHRGQLCLIAFARRNAVRASAARDRSRTDDTDRASAVQAIEEGKVA